MKFFFLFLIFNISLLHSQPIMNIHLNNGKVIQEFIGGTIATIYFNVHVGNSYWLNSNLTYDSINDQSGNQYKTIVIGSQIWMAENLRTTRFSNGDLIPNHFKRIDSLLIYQLPIVASPGWFYVKDSTLNMPYGKLYTPMTIVDQRNICPLGWHVPTTTDWYILFNNYGGINTASDELCLNNNQYWQDQSGTPTNTSGLSLLPSGGNGDAEVGNFSSYYSSSIAGQNLYYYEIMPFYLNSNLIELSTPNSMSFGGAVRCVKN